MLSCQGVYILSWHVHGIIFNRKCIKVEAMCFLYKEIKRCFLIFFHKIMSKLKFYSNFWDMWEDVHFEAMDYSSTCSTKKDKEKKLHYQIFRHLNILGSKLHAFMCKRQLVYLLENLALLSVEIISNRFKCYQLLFIYRISIRKLLEIAMELYQYFLSTFKDTYDVLSECKTSFKF